MAAAEPLGPVPTIDQQNVADIQSDPDLALPLTSDTIAALGLDLSPS